MGSLARASSEIARRSFTLLTEKYGVAPEDIIFDPLVLPVRHRRQKYVGSAVETIDGIRLIRRPSATRTILGISNGASACRSRDARSSTPVFLYHCVKAGLDLASVNTEKLIEVPADLPRRRGASPSDLIFNRGDDPVAAFAGYFKAKGAAPRAPRSGRGPRSSGCPATSWREQGGLVDDLEAVRTARMAPLDIINGPLMDGMRRSGRSSTRTNSSCGSAPVREAMKASVDHLRSSWRRHGGPARERSCWRP